MPLLPLLQFAVASLLLAVTPGPSVVLVVASGAEGGRRAGVTTALGLALGTTVWVVVVAAGLGSLLAARPGLLGVISAVGGVYLLTVAAVRWRSTAEVAAVAEDEPALRHPLRDGAVVNLLNPSIALFLAAVLPPFLVVDGPAPAVQILALGAVLVVVSTVVNAGYGIAGHVVGGRLRATAGGATTSRVVAVVYAVLGLLAVGSALG